MKIDLALIDDLASPVTSATGLIARGAHDANDPFQVGQRQSFFEDERWPAGGVAGAADRQVVDRAVTAERYRPQGKRSAARRTNRRQREPGP